MNRNLVAKSAVSINARASRVWDALVTPSEIKQYMFGADAESGWAEGSRIVWRGEWQGKRYEDKGRILTVDPERTLVFSHFGPLSGQPDTPEQAHTVTIDLSEIGATTLVTLSHDNVLTEEARTHAQYSWDEMLSRLKQFVEARTTQLIPRRLRTTIRRPHRKA